MIFKYSNILIYKYLKMNECIFDTREEEAIIKNKKLQNDEIKK